MKQIEPDFNFFLPITFEKATTKKGEKVMKIKGIASTADQDSEGEILEPVGFDLSRFLSIGYLNYNHGAKNDVSKIVGEPTVAKITPKGDLYVEGVLYNGHPLAESIWNMAETLERNGSKRKIGFSIEGRATERDIANPKRITKALLTGLAITPTPVNSSTYMELCKGIQDSDYINYEYDQEAILEKAEKESKYLFEFEASGKRYGINKSFQVEEIDKCMDTAATAPLVPESLDKKPKVLEPVIKKAILNGLIPIEKLNMIQKALSHKYIRKEPDGKGGWNYIYTDNEHISEDDINSEMYSLRKTFYKKFPVMSSNQRTIKAAKEISNKFKLPIKEILKTQNPDNNIKGDKSWDKEGNIISL